MRFQDTGLVNDPLVERAFNYARAYMQSLSKELLINYKEAINKSYDREFELLKRDLQDKLITPEEYEKEKAALEKQRAFDLRGPSPQVMSAALDKMFRSNAVATALELQNHGDQASPTLIAAAMLADCVRSPVDCKKIGKAFGEPVEDMIGTLIDVQAYPAEQAERTAAASAEVKRLLLAGLTNRFRKAADKAEPGQKISLQAGQAETVFQEIKLLWGVDKKLDTRLVSVFNQAATAQKSTYTLEINAKGLPELVNNAAPPPPPSKPGPKKPNFGDDGF